MVNRVHTVDGNAKPSKQYRPHTSSLWALLDKDARRRINKFKDTIEKTGA